MTFFTRGRDHLIHNTGVTANKVVFGALASKRQFAVADFKAAQGSQSQTGDHFQRSGGAQAGTLWYVTGDHHVHAFQGVTRLMERLHHASHIVAPEGFAFLLFQWLIQIEFCTAVVVITGDQDNFIIVTGRSGDNGTVIDGAG